MPLLRSIDSYGYAYCYCSSSFNSHHHFTNTTPLNTQVTPSLVGVYADKMHSYVCNCAMFPNGHMVRKVEKLNHVLKLQTFPSQQVVLCCLLFYPED
jgi:hypothetical protein